MSSKLVTVEKDDSIGHVKDIFESTKFHHVLVVEGKKLVGVVSDRDLLKQLSPFIGSESENHRDLATLNKRVHQIMSSELTTLTADDTVIDAVQIFNRKHFSCVPVVDENYNALGIISWRDILVYMEKRVMQKRGGSKPALKGPEKL